MSSLLKALRRAPAIDGVTEEERKQNPNWLLTLMKNKFRSDWGAITDQFAEDSPFLPLYWRNGVVLTRYPYSSIRDIREYELLDSIESYR